ncbi:MAG TPA: hypothetical protein VML55_04030 [Planctomycetaceae bacterium]|nr:hypothetical protein [Planctomycetaceae bacterium]
MNLLTEHLQHQTRRQFFTTTGDGIGTAALDSPRPAQARAQRCLSLFS